MERRNTELLKYFRVLFKGMTGLCTRTISALWRGSMQINSDVLENTCKNAIETILLSLKHATKGTIYSVGPLPKLRTVRVTSGIRTGQNGVMSWGTPQISDYNLPGRNWEEYRDQPGPRTRGNSIVCGAAEKLYSRPASCRHLKRS